MKNRKSACLTIFISFIVAMPAWVSAEPSIGRLLASQCAQCHGTNGLAVGDIDSLAGESFEELYDELLEMKYDDNPNDIMHRQARGYQDDQLRLIAEYYAGQPDNREGGDEREWDDDDHEEDHERRHSGDDDDDDGDGDDDDDEEEEDD